MTTNNVALDAGTSRSRTTRKRRAKPGQMVSRNEGNQANREKIAERAYWISQSEQAGSDLENWLRAEQEIQDA